jgi:hypothetical protein
LRTSTAGQAPERGLRSAADEPTPSWEHADRGSHPAGGPQVFGVTDRAESFARTAVGGVRGSDIESIRKALVSGFAEVD